MNNAYLVIDISLTGNASHVSENTELKSSSAINYSDIFADFLRNLFPSNIVQACLKHVTTERANISRMVGHSEMTTMAAHAVYKDGTNTLGIIVFSLALGFAISGVGDDGKPLFNLFNSMFKVSFWLMDLIILYSPIAIVSLIASSILEVEDLSSVLTAVAIYILLFVLCSLLHQHVILPALYYAFVRRNPFKYYFHFLLNAVVAGFIPPTSVVAIPMIQSNLKQKDEIDERVADFFFPIALGINRDGSAMFVCYTLIFIAQTQGMYLSMGDLFMIWLLGGILSIAIPDVPSGSVMLMLTLAPAVNIVIGDRLAIVMALEWIMDRIRTTTNIASTGYGAAIIDKLLQGKLSAQSQSSSQKTQIHKYEELSQEALSVSDNEESEVVHYSDRNLNGEFSKPSTTLMNNDET